MKTLMLALALPALLAAAAPPPAPAPQPSPSLDQMFATCRLPEKEAVEKLRALGEQAQLATILVCIGYQQGQADLLRALQGAPGKAARI